MPQNSATSPTSPSVPELPSSRPTTDHLPPKPSCSLIQKLASRAEGNVVCKKRKRSTERREQKVSNNGDRMCLAQRLRHHDTHGTDRHVRYDIWRTPSSSHCKEQIHSDSSPSNNNDTDLHSLLKVKSTESRISIDKGSEKTSSLPKLNNKASESRGSGNPVHDVQRPASQVINTVSSAASVDKFLDSIDLSNDTPSNPPAKGMPMASTLQALPPTPVSIASVPLPLPGSPVGDVPPVPTFASERLSLFHHGHPLNYDLNLLPNDPIGPITLLGATRSEPGAYLIVGAHYRRTGRSRSACEVIKALLQKHAPATRLGDLIAANKENASFRRACTSSADLPAEFALSSIDINTPAHEAAILRPAFLLLAACQLDISRGCSSPKEKMVYANVAQQLIRAVYGPKNDIPPSESGSMNANPNALGLAFTDCTRISSTVDSKIPTTMSKQTSSIPTAPAATRILALEEELRATRTAKATLDANLSDAKKRQELTEKSVKEAESRSRQALQLLEIERDEFRVLKRRLVEAEQKVSDMEQTAAGFETRVWTRLRDMVCDQFAGTLGL